MTQPDPSQPILDQYASPAGRTFYRHVMGAGSDHIHYGLYQDDRTPMLEALEAACRRLLGIAGERLSPQPIRNILDLGAGSGGPAKCLLSWTEAKLTCVDLGGPPLLDLEAWAAKAGLSPRLRTYQGSFSALPAEWSGAFDVVWSQDALCHARDRAAVFDEARRALRPGGVLVFSDILLAEDAPEQEARAFTAVNAVQNLGTPSAYARELRQAGFTAVDSEDWSVHLPMNFLRMREQIERLGPLMLREGVPPETLDRFAGALTQRLRWPPGSVLTWRTYLGQAPFDPPSG